MLWALGDRGQWAQSLKEAASKRNVLCQVFTLDNPPTVSSGTLFMRPDPEPELLERQRDLYHTLRLSGWTCIQDRLTIDCYEDKLKQVALYGAWMPRTLLLSSSDDAVLAAKELGYPFVSKSRTGAGSCNVRLIKDECEAAAEIAAVFNDGLPLSCQFGEERQRGYLIWQEFLPGNDGDYRVIVTGRYRMILRRHNATDKPFASGSGSFSAVTKLTPETKAVLDKADAFFRSEGLTWCGIDMVRDPTGDWKLLETSPAWTLPGYADCVYFDQDNPTNYRGADIWEVLLDEIGAGVFANSN